MDAVSCSKCGSEKVIPDISIVDHGYYDTQHELAIEMPANPKARFFKDTRKAVLKAAVCGQCGFVELSIDNYRELWDVYETNRKA